MPLIYDGPGTQYVPIGRNVSSTFTTPWILLIKYFPIQQNIISARGVAYVFKNLTATSLGEFFAIEQPRQFNDRNAHIMRFQATPGDIVSVTPYYDFDRIQVWTEGSFGVVL